MRLGLSGLALLIASAMPVAAATCIQPNDQLNTRRHEDKQKIALKDPAYSPRKSCSSLMSRKTDFGEGAYLRSDAGFSRTRSDVKGRLGVAAGKKFDGGLYTEVGFRHEAGDILDRGTSGSGSRVNRADLVLGYDNDLLKLESRLMRKRQLDPSRASRLQSDIWWDYQSRLSLKALGSLGVRPYVQYENKAINRVSAQRGARNEVIRLGLSLDF